MVEQCKFCTRSGLPILPLRFAYVPDGLPNLPASMATNTALIAPMKQGVYMLRVITEGYVFTYDTRYGGFWRCFAATAHGQLKEISTTAPPSAPVTFRCSQKGHNIDSSIIDVENVDDANEVWVGYSRVWWTKATRALLKRDTTLRKTFMVRINPAALANGGAIDPKDGFRSKTGVEIDQHVAEYGEFGIAELKFAKGTRSSAVDRSGQSADLAQKMQTMSPNGGAIVLALPDEVGVVQDIAHWRNIKAGELAQFQIVNSNARERLVGDLILGLQKSMEDHGQSEEWEKRYAPKLVPVGKITSDKKAYDDKVKAFTGPIDAAGDDWTAWAIADPFWQIWQTYDPEDHRTGLAMESDFATCVEGSGATKKEKEWWKAWLTAEPDDKKHPLWLALAAGDKEILEFITGDPEKPMNVGKLDKVGEVYKNSREASEKLQEWLEERREHHLARKAQTASGVLGNAIGSQLSRLAASQPDKVFVIGTRLRVIIAARLDEVITPCRMEVSTKQLVILLHETVWGPPTASLSRRVLEARSLILTQSVDGAFLGSHFTSAKAVELEFWMPESQLKLTAPAARAALSSPAAQIALPRPPINPFQAMRSYMSGGEFRIVGLIGALQMLNLASALVQYHRALKGSGPKAEKELKEATYGIVCGVLGVGGMTAEIIGGVAKARVTDTVIKTTAIRILISSAWMGLIGGLLASAFSWTEGVEAWSKSNDSHRSGNDDAGDLYYASSVMFFVSGGAGAAAAIITAGSSLTALGAEGALASMVISAGGVLACIPVWGWIVLGVLTLVAALVFLFRASTQEDTPLEIWLSRCVYRNPRYAATDHIVFGNSKEEMAAFQQAIYGLQVRLTWDDHIFGGKDDIDVEVVMPGFSKNSDYAYSLDTRGQKWNWSCVDRKTSALSNDPDLQPREEKYYMSAIPPGTRLIPMDDVLEIVEEMRLEQPGGGAVLRGHFKAGKQYLNRARLKLEYWPDVVNQPELKMTPIPGGTNLEEAGH